MTPLLPFSGGKTAEAARYLLLAATAMELDPLRTALQQAEGAGQGGDSSFDFLLCGVGPTAAAAALAGYLACRTEEYAGVILAGTAGAYPVPTHAREAGPGQAAAAEGPGPAGLLDLCLAAREVLGDFGVAATHGAEPFAQSNLGADYEFLLESPLLRSARTILQRLDTPFHCGTFITVNAATATLERGLALAGRHQGLCENMEGAAVALVCRNLGLPLLEIRCVSNMVEDRDPDRWLLTEAIRRNAEVLSRLLPELALASVAGLQANGAP
jgi:futalosine hydrolase